MLSGHLCPLGPRVGEGAGRTAWEKGEPAPAHTLVCTNLLPFSLFLFISLSSQSVIPSQLLPLPLSLSCCYFSAQALSLWISFDVCSPCPPPLLLMSTRPSTVLLLSPNMHGPTHFIFYIFTMFRNTNTIVLQLPIIVCLITCNTGL